MKIPEMLGKEAVILLLIQVIFLGGASFFLNAYYNSLISFDDIKWEKEKVECLSDDCKMSRQVINVYRFGKDLNEVNLSFKIVNPDFEIKNCSVTQYERSLLSFIVEPRQMNLVGRKNTIYDSNLNEKNSCNYEVSTLNSAWTYRMDIDLTRKNNEGKPKEKFGVFQIEDSKYTRYDHENLDFQDYLRLYLVQFVVVSIILVILSAILIFIVVQRILGFSNRGEVK